MKNRKVLVLLSLLCAVSLQAQIYTCDFEDSAEASRWVLNQAKNATVTAQLENMWYIGAPGQFAPKGSNGLYVSSDNGATASYTAKNTMFMTAYRDMSNVTMAAGDYELHFSYRVGGKNSSGEGFYICWVPTTQNTFSAPSAGGRPQWVEDYVCKDDDGKICFTGMAAGGMGKVNITHDGTPHKLVIFWFSASGTTSLPAASIDNLELWKSSTCSPVTNISHTISGDTVNLSWKGKADHYSVYCYDANNDTWSTQDNVKTNTCQLTRVSEGAHTFFVRAYCDGNTASGWVQYNQLIYHKGERCIDYMELTNKNCYTGFYGTPFSTKGKMDNGYADWTSRHTLHYVPNEYDANTDYQLRTCPEGYLASVRLGDGDFNNGQSTVANGTGHGLGEAVEFTYKVMSSSTGILKIKYAIALLNPHPENVENNPRFWVDVLSNGKRIANDCGYALYYAAAGDGWKEGAKTSTGQWLYHDWTELAINLRDYVGKTLTIRLVTTDCKPSGHTGYVYFVLDCESGEISGQNCGEDNPTTHFTAPSGFDYVWYKSGVPKDTLSRAQNFDIEPMDTTLYSVNIINKNNKDCWYTLDVSGLPRFPQPEVTYSLQTIRCENVVTFNNSTCVWRRNQVSEQMFRTDEQVTSLHWDFGDGVEYDGLDKVLEHKYPPEGGHYTLRLTASVSDGACAITKDFELGLPDLTTPTTVVEVNACRGDYPFGYTYGADNITFYNDIDTVFTYISQRTGCDSLCHLSLTFHEPGPYEVYDTICGGDSMLFFDRVLRETGRYDTTVQSIWQCDSIAVLELYVEPRLGYEVPDTMAVCPDDLRGVLVIPYQQTIGRLDSIAIRFDSLACAAGFDSLYLFAAGQPLRIEMPDSVCPNRYWATMSFITPRCEVPAHVVCVELSYSASVLYQNDGILAITNEAYNGGYTFDTYQWYRDGSPVEGANSPNLSVTDMDTGHEFYIVVRRDDGVQLPTCPIVYGVTSLEDVHLGTMRFPVHVYSPVGLYLGMKENVSELSNLPSGIYVLTDGYQTLKIVR